MGPDCEKMLSSQNAHSLFWVGTTDVQRWYAVHTRAKHERRVAAELQKRGIKTFVPVVPEVHRWSDRRRVVEVPLFPCYAFVCTAIVSEVQIIALRHPSVLRVIGFQGRPSPIPDEEILTIQTVLCSGVPVGPHAFVQAGERVRIRGGSLDGVEGVLIGNAVDRKLVVSVELVGQSVAVSLQNYELEQAV
jgi:transcription antitermination factor NusG